MDDFWRPRCNSPRLLVQPVPVDPTGRPGSSTGSPTGSPTGQVRRPSPGQARGPHWRRTSPGLYVPSEVDATLVEQRILEQAQRLPEGGVVTGWAALRLHGGGFFSGLTEGGRSELPVPLLAPPGTDLRRVPAISVRRERLPDEDVTRVWTIPCATALRATFDEARVSGDLRTAVVVLDMAMAAGLVTAATLAQYVAGRTGWAGLSRVRDALALADHGSRSPQESVLRLIWELDAGLPRPRCNVEVADLAGNRVGRPDLLSEEFAVVGEYDGAMHRGRERHRQDVRRADAFRRCGLELVTVVGADLANIALVVDRIHAAVARARQSGLPRGWMVRR